VMSIRKISLHLFSPAEGVPASIISNLSFLFHKHNKTDKNTIQHNIERYDHHDGTTK